MLRAALVGCGNIGAGGHLPACTHIPELDLVAVCDPAEELAHAAAQRSGATLYIDCRQLLEREDIEMVDLCAPPTSTRSWRSRPCKQEKTSSVKSQ